MSIKELHQYCMSIKGVTEHMPFNYKSIVYKIELVYSYLRA